MNARHLFFISLLTELKKMREQDAYFYAIKVNENDCSRFYLIPVVWARGIHGVW